MLRLTSRLAFTSIAPEMAPISSSGTACIASVYAERHDRIEDAIAREKAMKKWRRGWKIRLVEEQNPDWLDRYEDIL